MWEDKSEMYVQVAIFSMVAFIRAERLEIISPDDHGHKKLCERHQANHKPAMPECDAKRFEYGMSEKQDQAKQASHIPQCKKTQGPGCLPTSSQDCLRNNGSSSLVCRIAQQPTRILCDQCSSCTGQSAGPVVLNVDLRGLGDPCRSWPTGPK